MVAANKSPITVATYICATCQLDNYIFIFVEKWLVFLNGRTFSRWLSFAISQTRKILS